MSTVLMEKKNSKTKKDPILGRFSADYLRHAISEGLADIEAGRIIDGKTAYAMLLKKLSTLKNKK